MPVFASLEWYLDTANTITVIYRQELNRDPEAAGMYNWIFHAREHPEYANAEWILAQVRGSAEWHSIHDHVDPAVYTSEQLLAFRGSLFTVKAGANQLPWGPRPNQPDNIAFFGANFYTPEQRKVVYQLWKDRGYTHGAIGPFIDPGYHGQNPPIDFRSNPDAIADIIQEIWDNKLIPVIFLTPDGWTVDQLRTLEPIFKSDRWQKLCRVVVNGFEQQGSQYGWSNKQYVEYLSWVRDTFPNAVRGLHTVSDIEAPVGNGDDTSQPGMSNGECWGRVTPLIHFWLHQSNALFNPTHVDPNGDGRTDEAHWYDLWDKNNVHSLIRRFGSGTAGWPTFSANGGPMKVIAGEYLSFKVYWENWSEGLARAYGHKAVELGADGAMDGWNA